MLQKGFTLIELMIVVAIIGILSMFALPAYQDYTKRTYVSEGMALATAAKLAVSEYYSSTNTWPGNNSQAGVPAADAIKGQAVDGIGITAGDTDAGAAVSQIVIYYGKKVTGAERATAVTNDALTPALANAPGTLTIAPTEVAPVGSIQWRCLLVNGNVNLNDNNPGQVQGKWLPATCRTEVKS